MNIIKQRHKIVDQLNGQEILKKIELCGRVCYKSEDKITENSAENFVKAIIKNGHESVLEHVSFTVRFITDRAVTHELVRHRLASYSQESQRYVKYNDVEFILPIELYDEWDEYEDKECARFGSGLARFFDVCEVAEFAYEKLIKKGNSPQFARFALPNCAKTEIVVTANLREWRHILKLRTAKAAHPQIRNLMIGLLKDLKGIVPIVFDDIEVTE